MNNALKKIESERIILDPMSEVYVTRDYLKWLNDSEVIKYLEINSTTEFNDLKLYVNDKIKNKSLFWAIVIKNNNKHIGNIKLEPISLYHQTATLGIMLGSKDEWGKGYAKEAINILIRYSFNHLNLRKINLGVVESNINALKLYEKLGFKIEGKQTNQGYYNHKLDNVILMGLFKEDYDLRDYSS